MTFLHTKLFNDKHVSFLVANIVSLQPESDSQTLICTIDGEEYLVNESYYSLSSKLSAL